MSLNDDERISVTRQKKVIVVPVSGGKDSQVLAAWASERFAKERLRFVHQNTGYDHPLTYQHLRYMERRYGAKIEHTHSEKYNDIFDLIRKVKYFPGQVARSCTSRMKQEPFRNWLLRQPELLEPDGCHILMGMRAEESKKRDVKYGELEPDDVITLGYISEIYAVIELRHVTVSLPLVDWKTEQVFEYMRRRGDRWNKLYEKGHKRVGCYPCLLAGNFEWEQAAKDPVGREHMQELVQIENEFKAEKNPRKLTKIHPTRDVRALLAEGKKCNDEDDDACGWCSI